MSFKIGKNLKVVDLMAQMGFSLKVTPTELVGSKVLIEKIYKGSVNKDEYIEKYICIGGTLNGSKDNVAKVWFYLPSVDCADLINATDDEIKEIENGNYYYYIESKKREVSIPGKNDNYNIGYLIKGDINE